MRYLIVSALLIGGCAPKPEPGTAAVSVQALPPLWSDDGPEAFVLTMPTGERFLLVRSNEVCALAPMAAATPPTAEAKP